MGEEPTPAVQDRPIHDLTAHLVAMTRLAQEMVADGTRAFVENDAALAERVMQRDPRLDTEDVEMESETIRILALVQPEAVDLRSVVAVLKIANCVDRVGRLGYDLALLVAPGPEAADRTPLELLGRMETSSRAMIQEALDAFVQHDAAKAKRIFAMDDEVDAVHREVQKRVFALLRQGGPSTERLARTLLAARHLERVGDNACKMAEKAVYAITGERRPEYFPRRLHRLEPGTR